MHGIKGTFSRNLQAKWRTPRADTPERKDVVSSVVSAATPALSFDRWVGGDTDKQNMTTLEHVSCQMISVLLHLIILHLIS